SPLCSRRFPAPTRRRSSRTAPTPQTRSASLLWPPFVHPGEPGCDASTNHAALRAKSTAPWPHATAFVATRIAFFGVRHDRTNGLPRGARDRRRIGPMPLLPREAGPALFSCLETVRHFAAALGKLCHDLLLQPDVHRRRAIKGPGVAEFLRQLLASAEAAVQFQQLHQIDDRGFPIKIFILLVGEFRKDRFDISFRDRLCRRCARRRRGCGCRRGGRCCTSRSCRRRHTSPALAAKKAPYDTSDDA